MARLPIGRLSLKHCCSRPFTRSTNRRTISAGCGCCAERKPASMPASCRHPSIRCRHSKRLRVSRPETRINPSCCQPQEQREAVQSAARARAPAGFRGRYAVRDATGRAGRLLADRRMRPRPCIELSDLQPRSRTRPTCDVGQGAVAHPVPSLRQLSARPHPRQRSCPSRSGSSVSALARLTFSTMHLAR